MKRLKKTLKITGIVLGILIAFLLLAPLIFKSKIVEAIKTSANNNLNAKLNFSNDIHISFFRSFPNISVGIDSLSIVGKDSFAGDTLVYFPKSRFTLDLMSVIKGDEIKVRRVFLDQPQINIEYLPGGSANWDIVKTDTTAKADTAKSKFKMALKEFTIEHGHLIYNDRSLGFYTSLSDFSHTSTGDFTSDNFTLQTETHTPSLILGYGGINWLYKIKTDVVADIGMDMKNYKFTFEKGKAKLNDLDIESNGFVDLNDEDIDMDIEFKALQNDFKSFLSLVPGVYSESFKDVQASGSMGLSGSMRGKMTDTKMPAMRVGLNIQNGAFRYPSMPYSADRIFLDVNYSNPDGMPDNTVVDLKRLLMRIAGETFTMNALFKTPESDPYIEGAAKGKLDLSKIAGLIPMEKGTKLAGLLDADLKAKGNYSAVKSQNYGKLDATGWFHLSNFIYQSVTDKMPYELKEMALELSPQQAQVKSLIGNIGKNDFDISGKVENILGYAFSDETLKGTVNFKSNYFNINQFMSDPAAPENPGPADTGKLSIIEIPSNLDMTLNADVGKLIYDNYTLTNVGGTARVHDAMLDLNGLHAGILGGTIGLDGTYDSKNIKNPFTKMDTKIEKLNFKESFNYFTILQKYAPVAAYIDGLFNASVDMSSILNEKMQPNYQSMNVNGMVSFTDAAIKNSEILREIGKQFNVNWLENLQLKNQSIKFSIKEGVFQLLDSLVMPLGKGAIMKLSGKTKLDKSIQYGGWIKVPREALGAGNKVLNGWISQASTKGWNLNVEQMIPVDLNISGTILKPQVSVSLQGFAKSVASNLKDQATGIAKDEANKQLSEAVKQAKIQADKLREDARKAAEKVRQEGATASNKVLQESHDAAMAIRKQGDQSYEKIMAETETAAKRAESQVALPALKKAAGDKVRNEGQKRAAQTRDEFYKRAQQTEDEGQKKAQKIENESNQKAERIEAEAQKQADQLIKEAEAKGKI